MTTVKRNTVIVLILLVVSAFVYAGTQSRQDDPIVERIVAKCSSIESMRCDFSQVKTVPLMDAPQGSAGRMLYRRPSALKWAYTEPFVNSFTIDGDVISINNGDGETQVRKSGIDPSSDRVLFIISTTKGNVSLLDRDAKGFPQERVLLGKSAGMVTGYFGNPNAPIVVCNACISGVCAQIEAMRALQSGRYDYAVVTGADEQSPFIISGFLSFKALTDTPCRPFDKDRTGLNLGECAATVVLKAYDGPACGWVLEGGAIRNDANHISGPSRTGEGSYLALMEVLRKCGGTQGLAFINVHGTATAYNDEDKLNQVHDRARVLDGGCK